MKDEELLAKSKNGDEDAFYQLISKHISTVEKFAFQMGVHPNDIQDITQETFLKVYRYLNNHTHGKFTTWLYQITLNVVRDLYRKKKRLAQKAKAYMAEAAITNSPDFVDDTNLSEVHQAIQDLNEKYKLPIILHYFHELSYQEIGDVLGVSEGAVKTRMLRGRKMLKERLEQVGEYDE
ncbi:RNA polymerase sigma factor [Alkalihalobacterium elongatum]|uniref:RNA polymerase sigma factor n=1 Tax=Alkalihalobacterium elongatum TaxID=2675466 RepID=UPI001C1FB46B|nr:RNA polymerase sigma factor [Alkalihalobacterium elongatum]